MKSVLLLLIAVSPAFAGEPPITSLAFAPDGKSCVATSQSGLHVFDWPGLERRRTIATRAANLHAVVFSPNGKLVAVGGGDPLESGGVEVFSWPQGKPVANLGGHADSVRAVVWRDDASLLTASLDREIGLWQLDAAKPLRTFKGHSRSVDALELLADGKTLVSAGSDQSLRVWNVETGELIRSLNQHTKPVHALALRPGNDGLPMIASAAGDRTIRFWQPTIGRMVRYIRLDSVPLAIAWTPDGTSIVAACVDGRVRWIDPIEVEVVRTRPAIDGWAYAIAVHPKNGEILVGGAGGVIRRLRATKE